MFNKSKKVLAALTVGTTAVVACMFGLLITILQEEKGESPSGFNACSYSDDDDQFLPRISRVRQIRRHTRATYVCQDRGAKPSQDLLDSYPRWRSGIGRSSGVQGPPDAGFYTQSERLVVRASSVRISSIPCSRFAFVLPHVCFLLPSLRGYSADRLRRVFATFFATELVWVIAGVSFLIQVSSTNNEIALIVLLTSPTILKSLSASPSLLRASGASASCSTSGDTGKQRRQNQSCTSQ